MTRPIQTGKTYGVLNTEDYFSFIGFAKKVGSDETQKIDVFLDDKLIDTIIANEFIQKIDDMYDVESKAFTYNLPVQYIGKKAIISFKNHDSGEELLNSPYTLIDKNHEGFNEAKFLHSLSEPLSEELKNMYKPNSIGFLATKENIEDEEFMGYIKELIERFPDVEFKGFCFNNSFKSQIRQKIEKTRLMIVLLENIGNLLKESSVFIFNARTLSSNTHLWNFITSNCKNIHTFGYDSNWIYKKIDVTTINRFDLLFRSTVYESKKLSETKTLYELWFYDSIEYAKNSQQFVINNFIFRNSL